MNKKVLIIAIVVALLVSMMLTTVGCDMLGKDQVPSDGDNGNIDDGNEQPGDQQPDEEGETEVGFTNKNTIKFIVDNFDKFLAVESSILYLFNGAMVDLESRTQDFYDTRCTGFFYLNIAETSQPLFVVFLDKEYTELDAKLKEFLSVDMGLAEYELKGDFVVSGNDYDEFLQLDTSGVDKAMLDNAQKAFDDMLAIKSTIYFVGSENSLEIFNAVSDGNCDSYYSYVKIDEAERDNKLLKWNNEKGNYTQDSYCYYENGYLVTWYTYKEGLSYTLSSDGLSYSVKRFSYSIDDEKNIVIPSEYNGKPVTEISVMAFVSIKGLKSITIPDSVTKFGWLIISLCDDFKTINYQGTMGQWNAIEKQNGWVQNSGNVVIHCNDGDIAK
ncbi:MAG: hypothetical protein SO434_08005 [Eubacteriales bacterium]|nr:hypothetical protein [Eubacteriales bacterium]